MLKGVGPKRKYQHQLPLITRPGEENWFEKKKRFTEKKSLKNNDHFGSVEKSHLGS